MQSKGESAASGSALNQPRLPPITKRGFSQPTRRDKFSGVLLPALFYAARYTDGPRYIDYIGRTRHPHAACALDTSVAGVDPAPRRVATAHWRGISHTHTISLSTGRLYLLVSSPPLLSLALAPDYLDCHAPCCPQSTFSLSLCTAPQPAQSPAGKRVAQGP